MKCNKFLKIRLKVRLCFLPLFFYLYGWRVAIGGGGNLLYFWGIKLNISVVYISCGKILLRGRQSFLSNYIFLTKIQSHLEKFRCLIEINSCYDIYYYMLLYSRVQSANTMNAIWVSGEDVTNIHTIVCSSL